MRLGIWTAYYLHPNLSLEDVLRRLSGLGWKDVELSTEHVVELLQDADGQKRLNRVRTFLEGEGMKAWQLHTKIDLNVAHFDPAQRAQEALRIEFEVLCSVVIQVDLEESGVFSPQWRPMTDLETVKAIFFDLGDTLINSRIFGPNGHLKAVEKVIELYHLNKGPFEYLPLVEKANGRLEIGQRTASR